MKTKLFLLLTFFSLTVFSQNNWEQKYASSFFRSSINIFDENKIWIGGQSSTGGLLHYKTLDGGTNWTNGNFSSENFIDFIAVNENTGWYISNSFGNYIIRKTSDGGTNWNIQLQTNNFMNIVHFWDENKGVIIGDPISEFDIYTTNNGGDTWSQVAGNSIPDPLSGEWGLSQMKMVYNNIIIFITSKGRLFKSIDYGSNWSVLPSPIPDNNFSYTIKDENNIWLYDKDDDQLWNTTDGGVNWSIITYQSTIQNIGSNCIHFIKGSGNQMLASTYSPNTHSTYSIDNGLNWTDFGSVNMHNISSFNQSNVWGVNSIGIYKLAGPALSVNDFEQYNFTLFPNPTTDFITIKGTTNILNASLYNLQGQKIPVTIENKIINLENYTSGLYFLKLRTENNETHTFKIIKQ